MTLHFFLFNSTEGVIRTVCDVTHWSAGVCEKVLEPQVIPSSDEYNTDPLYLFFFFHFYISNAIEFKIRRGAGSHLANSICCFVTSTEICFKLHFLQVQHEQNLILIVQLLGKTSVLLRTNRT